MKIKKMRKVKSCAEDIVRSHVRRIIEGGGSTHVGVKHPWGGAHGAGSGAGGGKGGTLAGKEPTGGGGSIPQGYEAVPKPYNWSKSGGKMGSPTVRFRFYDEGRGERFFDSEFVVSPRSTAGTLKLGNTLAYGGRFGASAKDSGIVDALKSGTVLSMTAGWIGPRGQKPMKTFQAVVHKVGSLDESGWHPVEYTEIRPKSAKK